MRRSRLATIAAGFAAMVLAVMLFSYGRLMRDLEIAAVSADAGIVERSTV